MTHLRRGAAALACAALSLAVLAGPARAAGTYRVDGVRTQAQRSAVARTGAAIVQVNRASAGVNDIDGGTTTLTSPAIALPTGSVRLSLSYYLAHGSNATADDFFRVRALRSSGSTTVLNVAGAAVDRDAAWTSATLNLDAFAGQTVRIVIEAADAGTASLVEAAVDDVRVSRL